MYKVFDRTKLKLKIIPKQVSKIKFTQIVTRAQLADTASTQSKRIILYIYFALLHLYNFMVSATCPQVELL